MLRRSAGSRSRNANTRKTCRSRSPLRASGTERVDRAPRGGCAREEEEIRSGTDRPARQRGSVGCAEHAQLVRDRHAREALGAQQRVRLRLERRGARPEAAVDRVPHHDAGNAGPDRVAKAFELLAPVRLLVPAPGCRSRSPSSRGPESAWRRRRSRRRRGRGRTRPHTRRAESGATRAGRPASRGQARGRRRRRRGPAPVPPPARRSAPRGRSGSSLRRRRAGAPDRRERGRPPGRPSRAPATERARRPPRSAAAPRPRRAGAGGDETTSSAAFSRGVSASTRDVSPT